jgi:hypothetical protein
MGKKKISYFEDHKKPNTRREFLASGMMSFSAYMMTPSILSILANPSIARAASDGCEAATSGPALPAFVGVNLSGGASLSGNVIVHDRGGQLLPAYNQLGLGTTPQTETEFGNVLFPSATSITQSFLTGMRSQANGALAKSSFVSVCVPLADDTSNNAIDPTGMVTAAGLVGSLLPKLGSTNNTGTGISQKASNIQPPAPLVVKRLTDLTTALAPASSLTRNLNATQQKSLLSLVSDLSGSQARAVAAANSSSSQTLSKLVQCATGKNVELATQTNPGIDPQLDNDKTVSNLWQMTTGGTQFGRSQNERQIFGSMVYNGLKGNSGAVGLELGGYDYHGQGAATQNQKDFDAGQLVGKILATAQAMNQKVFIHITSDGSVGAPSGSGLRPGFTSDRGSGGMSYMIAFDPAARPSMKNDRTAAWQLGYYTNGQGAADDTLVGSADKAGVAAFANYLAFAKQTNLFSKVLSPLSTSDQDYIVRFA